MSRPLPAALRDVSEQWYTLCERAPHAEKMSITGELAEAIVHAVCDTEPRAGDGVAWDEGLMAAIKGSLSGHICGDRVITGNNTIAMAAACAVREYLAAQRNDGDGS